MTLIIETELKEIFTQIDQRLDRMEQNINDKVMSYTLSFCHVCQNCSG